MAGISQYLVDKYSQMMAGTAFTAPATYYVALLTSAATLAAAGTELTAVTGYSRQTVTWGAQANGGAGRQSASTSAPSFGPITGGTGIVVVGWQGYDAVTVGNPLDFGVFTGVQDVQTVTPTAQLTGGTYTLNPGGTTTVAIPYNATAATILELLEAANGIGTIQSVAFSNTNRFDQVSPGNLIITFAAYAAVTLMTLTPTSITGGTISIAHTTTGATGAITLATSTTINLTSGQLIRSMG